MIKDILTMNGYGLYVWLSFAVTFFSCIFYYVKTYKELKKYEKEFAKEFIQLARNVYITNDKRAELKKQINLLFNSSIIEVKSYKKY